MNNFKRWNQDFFIFQKRSRLAILSIVVFGMCVMGSVNLYYTIKYPLSEQVVEISSLEKKQMLQLEEKLKTKKNNATKWTLKLPAQKFDPNSYELEDWMNLGYSQKQAQAVVNYRNSGFEFRVKSDLKKLFIIDEKSYRKLYPYIDLPDSLSKNKPEIDKKSMVGEVKFVKLSLNKITKDELMQLRGVGSYYASKILNFRDALGGFVNLQQLYEVYHLPDSVVDQISTQLTVDTNIVKQRNINEINLAELKQHPYISYKLANSIIAFRKTHGAYSSIEDLKELVLIDAETFQKVRPYLKVK